MVPKAMIRLIDVGDDRQSAMLFTAILLVALCVGAVTGAFGGLVALLGLLFLIFMGVAINDYRSGLLIAIILLPLSSTHLIPRSLFGVTGLNPLNATLIMIAMSLLFQRLFGHAPVRIPRISRYYAIYLLAIMLAALHGALHAKSIPSFYEAMKVISFNSAAGYLRDVYFKPMLILVTSFMLAIAVRNARHPGRYLVPLFFSALVLPCFVLLYIVVSGASLSTLASSQSRGFLSVTGMHANELGLMFNMALALTLFTFFSLRPGLVKRILAVTAAILVAAVLLTFSRGAYLGLAAMLAYFLYRGRRFNTIATGIVLIGLLALVVPHEVIQRATTGTANHDMDAISAGRIDRIWLPLLPEVLDSPIVGHGLSSILWSESARHGFILKVGHPHSAYIGVLLDLGIAGAVVIAVFFAHMLRFFARLASNAAEPVWRGFFHGGVACVLLLLVQGLTDDRFTPTFSQPFLWMAYGIAIGMAGRDDIRAGPAGAHDNPSPSSRAT